MRRSFLSSRDFPSRVSTHSSGPTSGRRHNPAAWPRAPFPSSMDAVPDREGSVKGAPVFGAACEPLTDPSRSLQSGRRERGPGVSGGVSDVMLMYLLNERNQLG